MTKGFMDSIKDEQKKYGAVGGGGDYFHFDNAGMYKMRILVQPKVIATHFFGKGNPAAVCIGVEEGCQFHKEDEKKPSIKLATYIIDREDKKIKLAELPLSISYALQDLQNDIDFAFDEFPMPYDVKITYDPENNDPKAKYRLTPSPKQEAIKDDEREALDKAMEKQTPEQYVENKKKRQKEKDSGEVSPRKSEYPADDINPDDIPF
jgi:hypothetical protein